MSTVSLLAEHELDAVCGGFFSFNVIGLNVQANLSTTNQGQVNLAGANLFANQGGPQIAQTVQSNSVG